MSFSLHMVREKIYPAGSFHGWREEFINRLSDFDFNDPRTHRQHAVAKLVEDDMNAAQNCPIFLAYFPEGKSRGTMTYAEMGASRTKGNCIITIDEDSKDPLFEKVASHSFNNKEEAFDLLKTKEYSTKFDPINPEKEEICKSILFLGDSFPREVIEKVSKTKRCLTSYDASNLDNFAKDVDMTVVNFEKEKMNREAIFYMGVSYALDIPSMMVTSHPLPYRPLKGLIRNLFTKKERFDALTYYLTKIKSHDIKDEATIMYELYEKYNT